MRLAPLPVGNPLALAEAWLLLFPADYWYRQKYNLPLLGPQHRATDLRSIRVEFEQENMLRRLRGQPKPKTPLTPDELAQLPLLTPKGQQILEMSDADIDAEFEKLELGDFDDQIPEEPTPPQPEPEAAP